MNELDLGQHTSGILLLNAQTEALRNRFTLIGMGLLSMSSNALHSSRDMHSPGNLSGVVHSLLSASSGKKLNCSLTTKRTGRSIITGFIVANQSVNASEFLV